MAGEYQSVDTDISTDATDSTAGMTEYDFYQLAELLRKSVIAAGQSGESAIRFTSDAGIAFPARDVTDVTRRADGSYDVKVAFLGLHGSQSPLPGYYLDNLAWEDAQQTESVTDFLNLFNHRFVSLLHRIWRKYRYYISFEPDGRDAFSRYMFALLGLGSENIRNRIPINHNKMLAYAGLLASPGRSADVICSLISHCFDLDEVNLIGWETRRVSIPDDQQNRLGTILYSTGQTAQPRSLLGENFSLGAGIEDCNGKCTIEISELPLSRYMRFLPNGPDFLPLVTFVSYIMHEQLAWDLRLCMAEKQVGGMVLGEKDNNQLGWRSFLGKPELKPFVTISVLE